MNVCGTVWVGNSESSTFSGKGKIKTAECPRTHTHTHTHCAEATGKCAAKMSNCDDGCESSKKPSQILIR